MFMNKLGLIEAVAGKTNSTKSSTQRVLNALVATITEQLSSGQNVKIVGFGTFKVTSRAAREGIIPTTKATIKIPEKKVAKFVVGKDLGAAVNR
jgi:DNA-binding protein HU-beta